MHCQGYMTIKQLYDKIKVLSTPACCVQQTRCDPQDRFDVPSSTDPQEITDHAHTCYTLSLPPHRSSRPGMGKRRAKASTSALTEAIFFLMSSSSLSLALNSRSVGPACCCTSWASLMPATPNTRWSPALMSHEVYIQVEIIRITLIALLQMCLVILVLRYTLVNPPAGQIV